MRSYIVFGSVKRPQGFSGGSYLDWQEKPLGVYQADTGEEACQEAARDSNGMGTFIAVEGILWGVALMESGAKQFGKSENVLDRIASHMDRMAANQEHIRELEAQKSKADRMAAETDAKLAALDAEPAPE